MTSAFVCDVYESTDGSEISVIPRSHSEKDRQATLGDVPARIIRTIEGDTWEEVMTKHHQLMGWAPYVPMKDP